MGSWFGLLATLALVAGGCFGPASRPGPIPASFDPRPDQIAVVNVTGVENRPPACDAQTCSEYFFLLLWGSENATRARGVTLPRTDCSADWRFNAFANNGTLRYNGTRYRWDIPALRTIIGENLWSVEFRTDRIEEGCPQGYGLTGFYPDPSRPFPRHKKIVGSYGLATITVYPDGLMAFGEPPNYFVELGRKVVVSYERLRATSEGAYFVKGGFEVVNLGPWSKAYLVPAEGGPVTRGPG